MSDFAKNLKNLRLKKGLLQEEVANALGISKQVVSTYENGTRSPSFDGLIKIAAFFGVTTDYLLGVDSLGLSPEAMQKISDLNTIAKQNLFDEPLRVLSKIIESDKFLELVVYSALYVYDGQIGSDFVINTDIDIDLPNDKILKAIISGNNYGLSEKECRMINDFRRELLLMLPRDEFERILDEIRIQKDTNTAEEESPIFEKKLAELRIKELSISEEDKKA